MPDSAAAAESRGPPRPGEESHGAEARQQGEGRADQARQGAGLDPETDQGKQIFLFDLRIFFLQLMLVCQVDTLLREREESIDRQRQLAAKTARLRRSLR